MKRRTSKTQCPSWKNAVVETTCKNPLEMLQKRPSQKMQESRTKTTIV
jgi:hypothetical protein